MTMTPAPAAAEHIGGSVCSSKLAMISIRIFAFCTALLWRPAIGFGPAGGSSRTRHAWFLVRGGVPAKAHAPSLVLHNSDLKKFDRETDFVEIPSATGDRRRGQHALSSKKFSICAALMCLGLGAVCVPSSFASTNGVAHHIPTISDLKSSLISILDGLSHSGTTGMAIYAISFIIWTMTVGVTTPIETAAGMAFPLQKSIPLSAIGKIGGAFFQYTLAKYLFSDYARKKLEDNEWIDKINVSFETSPYKVALIWRFSPLPEFVKNIGPALVPSLKTRYQLLATLTHGLPFTVLWSCIGNEAAMVARGGQASSFLKRTVAVISWVGLVVSPTVFGWWIKGLGESSSSNIDDIPSKVA